VAADTLRPAVLGARLLGSGRVRFCRAAPEGTEVGAWIAVAAPERTHEAPGRVVVAPRQLVFGEPPARLALVTRRLTAAEVARLPALAEMARDMLDRAIAGARELGLPIFLTGLSPDLDGPGATVDWRGPESYDPTPLQVALTGSGMDVRLTGEGPLAAAGDHLFGGLGRLPAAPLDLKEIMRARFGRPGRARPFAPEGLPRLGSRVTTPHGGGTVRSISTRRHEALVRLDSGDDVTLPVDALVPA
jgi:hypothetical protein